VRSIASQSAAAKPLGPQPLGRIASGNCIGRVEGLASLV
jgi:hypothetical protein